jgi:single-strand DNA-binding protein
MTKNLVRLSGHSGSDPETRMLSNGSKWAKFPLATNDKYKNGQGEWQEITEWHSVVCFGKNAEKAVEFVKKGKEILLEGRIHYSVVTDDQGQKRYFTEIVANDIVLLEKMKMPEQTEVN